jgi:hypothetical protein
MAKIQDYQVLLEACSQRGCPICRLAQQNATRYLESWKYELFTDVELRALLRRTLGFCHNHTWQLVRMGATLQLAQSYQEIVSDAIDGLQRKNMPATSSTNALRRLFGTTHNMQQASNECPACQRQFQAEERYADSLRQVITEDEFHARFLESQGLCLHHFRVVCELKTPEPSGPGLSSLRAAQLHCLQKLDAQLAELIRKHDYRFQYEQRGEEMYSWIIAAGIVAGEDETGIAQAETEEEGQQ